MKAITHPAAAQHAAFETESTHFTLPATWHKFIGWATGQEQNRMLWVAISLAGHGTVFTILTFITVILTGNIFALLIVAIFTMATVVVVNLAALPTKYTVPVFFISLLVDAGIIITAISLYISR